MLLVKKAKLSYPRAHKRQGDKRQGDKIWSKWAHIQAQQLEDEVSDNGLAFASPDLSLGEGINFPVCLHIHLFLFLLQLLQLLCTIAI